MQSFYKNFLQVNILTTTSYYLSKYFNSDKLLAMWLKIQFKPNKFFIFHAPVFWLTNFYLHPFWGNDAERFPILFLLTPYMVTTY